MNVNAEAVLKLVGYFWAAFFGVGGVFGFDLLEVFSVY